MKTSYKVGVNRWNRIRMVLCCSFLITMLMAISFTDLAYAQQDITVTGIVLDQDGQPLPGATVIIENTEVGTSTNVDGKYEIEVQENAVLVFSFIGYETLRVPVEGRSIIDVNLEASEGMLDELVVIGYSEMSRRNLTTSVGTYDPKGKLEGIAINTMGEGLKGKISGVRVFNFSGQPGEEPSIRIRGGSSIQNSNDPLVLIDGLERNLGEINPQDIESINVLKDAAATSIYGSRGSNGVVLVTTKRGGYNTAPQITFETNVTHQNIERYYDRLNAEEYLNLARPALARSPNPDWLTRTGQYTSTNNDENSFVGLRYLESGQTPPEGWKTMADPLDPSRTLTFVDNDMKDVVFNPALRTNYYLGASGGTESIRYSGSIGFTDDEGVVYATGWKRFSARANTDVDVTDKIRLSTSLDFSEREPEAHPNQNNAIGRAAWGAPTQRLYMDDGTPARGWNATSGSPTFWVHNHLSDQKDRSLNISSELSYDILENLNASITGQRLVSDSQFETFQRANVFNTLRPARSSYSKGEKTQLEALLTYNLSVGSNHNFNIIGGGEYYEVDNFNLTAAARGGATDKVLTLNVAPEKTEATTIKSGEVLTGVFGNISYDYMEKYFLSASLRRDGSSRFGANNRFSLFPSVSVGWNVTEEEFLNDSDILSFLKLRASIGQTGNNSIGLYTAQGSYSLGYSYDGNAGLRNTVMPNRSLTWEQTTQYDIGVDFGFLNDRISLSADLYDKVTDNLLFSVPLPNTSGFSSIESNVGEVRYYGYDVELVAKVFDSSNFSWTTSFTIGGNKNEVLKLPDNGRENNRIGGWVVPDGEDFGGIAEGEPLGRIYGHKVDYIIDNQQQADNALYDEYANGWDHETQTYEEGRKRPGDYEWVDRDGDGRITERDQFNLGNSIPHTFGGITNTVQYQNLTFSLHLDFALGHSMLDQNYGFSMHSGIFNNLPKDRLDSWEQPGDAERGVEFPRMEFHSTWENQNFRRPSSAWLFDLDYLAVREVSINYELPNRLIDNLGLRNFNIYLTGNNLHYFSDVLATPPEVSTNGYNSNVGYPPVRKLTFGIRTNF